MRTSYVSLLFTFLTSLLLLRGVHVFGLSAFPPDLNGVLCIAGFSEDEIQQVREGKILRVVRKSPNKREIVLSYAVLIRNMTPEQAKNIFLSYEKKREVDVTTTDYGTLREGSLEEFEKLTLDPKASKWANKYINAKPGTQLNLSEDEIAAFNELQESSNPIKAVEKQIRQNLSHRYKAYRERGLKGILPYARENGETLNPADELLSHKTKLTETIQKDCPAFYRHLYEYPKHPPEGLKESFSWFNLNADGTPTYVLSHRMGMLDQEGVQVLSDRVFYNSCFLNCVQSTGGAFPVEGGTAVVFSVRASTDMVTGFGGSAKRAIGTKIMGATMVEQLERIQQLQMQ